MKILHTSDWHLGQNFFTKSRKEEHQAFLLWLLAQVKQHQIDAVIVAGDIFDIGAPPSYARELYNQFVVQMNQLQCTLVVLGGNHDSVAMLNESKALLSCLDTYVVANVTDDLNHQVIELKDKQGKVSALLCAVPFIRPRDILASQAGESSGEKRHALGEAIKQHYHQLYQCAQQRCQDNGWQIPIIATGHLTAMGVKSSESVRDIYIGSLEGFDASGFPPADYIALGHIHRPQVVAKSEHIRYCGSPIPLSFDELKFNKQVLMVCFDDDNRPLIEPISVPIFQPMLELKGNLQTIEQQLGELSAPQNRHNDQGDKTLWLSIVIEQQEYLTDLQQRIQQMTQDLPVEVLQLRRARVLNVQGLTQQSAETLEELTPLEVFEKRLALESFDEEQGELRISQLTSLFNQVWHDLQHDDEAKQKA